MSEKHSLLTSVFCRQNYQIPPYLCNVLKRKAKEKCYPASLYDAGSYVCFVLFIALLFIALCVVHHGKMFGGSFPLSIAPWCFLFVHNPVDGQLL